jgi:hypothetical protein
MKMVLGVVFALRNTGSRSTRLDWIQTLRRIAPAALGEASFALWAVLPIGEWSLFRRPSAISPVKS